MTELKQNDTVKELVDLFNVGKVKYQDVIDLFGVSRDLIQKRLAGIDLRWDNKAKIFVGDPTESDLKIRLSDLFQRQRTNNSPKVRTNVGTKEQTMQSNAPTKEHTNVPIIIRKRSSFDIDVELMKELKIKAILHDRTVYEIVETAIRRYLKELGS